MNIVERITGWWSRAAANVGMRARHEAAERTRLWDGGEAAVRASDDPFIALVRAIEDLPEREQYVMSMYYEHDMNLREIAAVLGVTESRVCQLHSQSVARLRARLSGW